MLGEAIRTARWKNSLSVRELQEKTGLSVGAIANAEKGSGAINTTLKVLSDFFELKEEYSQLLVARERGIPRYRATGAPNRFALRLRRARIERGFTQDALAKLAMLTRGSTGIVISDMERGNILNVQDEEKDTLAKVLGVPVEYFTDESDLVEFDFGRPVLEGDALCAPVREGIKLRDVPELKLREIPELKLNTGTVPVKINSKDGKITISLSLEVSYENR